MREQPKAIHNADSAARAAKAIAAYMAGEDEFCLQDLICDLGHWLAADGGDGDEDGYTIYDNGGNVSLRHACDRGVAHYEAESGA